jgi:hypothetical protein
MTKTMAGKGSRLIDEIRPAQASRQGRRPGCALIGGEATQARPVRMAEATVDARRVERRAKFSDPSLNCQ